MNALDIVVCFLLQPKDLVVLSELGMAFNVVLSTSHILKQYINIVPEQI
jgi:hypothetical protein